MTIIPTAKPFRVRASEAINKAIDLRLFLIQTNRSKNGIKYEHCMKVRGDIEPLRSDWQWACYLLDNFAYLLRMQPGPNHQAKIKLQELKEEAISITIRGN